MAESNGPIGEELLRRAKDRVANRAKRAEINLAAAQMEAEAAQLEEEARKIKLECKMMETEATHIEKKAQEIRFQYKTTSYEPREEPTEEHIERHRSIVTKLMLDLLEAGLDPAILGQILNPGVSKTSNWRYCPYCGRKMEND